MDGCVSHFAMIKFDMDVITHGFFGSACLPKSTKPRTFLVNKFISTLHVWCQYFLLDHVKMIKS